MKNFALERAKVKSMMQALDDFENAVENIKKECPPADFEGNLAEALRNKAAEIAGDYEIKIAEGRLVMQQILDTIAEIEAEEEAKEKALLTAQKAMNTAKKAASSVNSKTTSAGAASVVNTVKKAASEASEKTSASILSDGVTGMLSGVSAALKKALENK